MACTTAGDTQGYVLGFLFDPGLRQVVMILKNKPEWMKGRWNGVGGHIEEGEKAGAAMMREFAEETGVTIPMADWSHPNGWTTVGIVKGAGLTEIGHAPYEMTIFAATSPDLHQVRTTTDERVVVMDVDDFTNPQAPRAVIRPWLMLMALDHLAGGDGNKFYEITHA